MRILNPSGNSCTCDYLADLTDGMITRTSRRLFDPEFGSFRDLY